uniref:Secreted protein n=1 Tax=Strongyloides papillosus TaxID=174720 RepID=A0A0N5B2E7_STREA
MRSLILYFLLTLAAIDYGRCARIAKVGDDYILNYNLQSFFDDALIHNDDGSVSLKALSTVEEDNYNDSFGKINSLSMPITITNPFANLFENFGYFIDKIQKKFG